MTNPVVDNTFDVLWQSDDQLKSANSVQALALDDKVSVVPADDEGRGFR